MTLCEDWRQTAGRSSAGLACQARQLAAGTAVQKKPALANAGKGGMITPVSGFSTSSVCKRAPMARYAIPADSCRAGGILHKVPDGRPNRSPQRPE